MQFKKVYKKEFKKKGILQFQIYSNLKKIKTFKMELVKVNEIETIFKI